MNVEGTFLVEALDVFSAARSVDLQTHEPVADEKYVVADYC